MTELAPGVIFLQRLPVKDHVGNARRDGQKDGVNRKFNDAFHARDATSQDVERQV